MCGIALIISGVRFDLSSLLLDSTSPAPHVEPANQAEFSIDDLKAALRRRGPDSLGSKKVFLDSNLSSFVKEDKVLSFIEVEEEVGETEKPYLRCCRKKCDGTFSENGEFDELENNLSIPKTVAEMHFIGATLQLRGINPITQPLMDTSGNILIYNGAMGYNLLAGNFEWIVQEPFGLVEMHLEGGASLSTGQLWRNSRLLLSSVSPHSSFDKSSDFEVENDFWEELSCGIYSISMDASKVDGRLVGEVKRHEWTNPILKGLIKWERTSIEPKSEDYLIMILLLTDVGTFDASVSMPAQIVLSALKESVMRRTTLSRIFQAVTHDIKQKELVPVAILFSGGLDSMILAALLDKCLDPSYEIDLLNVSFDGESAPDRISARAGVKELKLIAPSRRWKLVEIDADLSKLTVETKHVMSLINPAKTYMLAVMAMKGLAMRMMMIIVSLKYKSEARILLVGSGADEQCAGYGRHRTKYRHGSWLGLHEEMKLDMQRIWKRNLGRDDRCLADNGKEARFPFLDEDVIRTLLDIPLWEVADLDQPSGTGDKKILREVAHLLGLHGAAVLPKRAIQFGSRIARESNRKNFGSNRAANQASAGSAVIYATSDLT
ncbi:hypothetical protein L1049_005631 [Liquidambar formosana]|uniref:Asparagine synthetase domain-containing protein n=1 Tax=Liquidambar formosana TaxID=63359 RepID=A0AAP0WT49_LIQFO